MANVIFTSVGTGGDILPLVRIGVRLKACGHEVSLLTHVGYANLAAEAGLDFRALDTAAEYARFIEDCPLLNTPRGIPEFLRRHYLPKVPREFEMIYPRCRVQDTILIARDLFDIGARIAAEKLGIPVLWIFLAPSQLLNWPLRRVLFSQVLAADINHIRQQWGLSPVADWSSWLGYPRRNLGLWPAWFAPSDPAWPAAVVPVGFILDNEGETGEVPEEITAARNGGESQILITGGTGTYMGAAFYSVAAEACQQLHRRGILVTPHDQMVPSGLPSSIQRYRHLPFSRVMPIMGAVLHHGGRGTFACALASGTPQVVMAWGADRPDNARRLEQLGVAAYLPLPAWKAETVAEALRHQMNSAETLKCCQDVASQINARDSLTAACQVIEAALESDHRGWPAAVYPSQDSLADVQGHGDSSCK
jgi:UDP:flavonoid glycosyltransferase YjiC (YdhE family)